MKVVRKEDKSELINQSKNGAVNRVDSKRQEPEHLMLTAIRTIMLTDLLLRNKKKHENGNCISTPSKITAEMKKNGSYR